MDAQVHHTHTQLNSVTAVLEYWAAGNHAISSYKPPWHTTDSINTSASTTAAIPIPCHRTNVLHQVAFYDAPELQP